ncbi:MAG: antibiotic biosynthesis monooxygenase [Actinobacteria bacterium ATB1]|nr:antibiotic biosynthesis monooxygenase [Actinobacteria bacterium ATB1]
MTREIAQARESSTGNQRKEDPMSKIAVVAKLTCQPGRRDEFLEAAAGIVDHANQNEAGTEFYAMHKALDDDDTVWFYELYADDAAFMAHSTSDAMADFIAKIGGLLGGAPELIRMEPCRGSAV